MNDPYRWNYSIKIKTKEGKYVSEEPPVKKLVKEKKNNEQTRERNKKITRK